MVKRPAFLLGAAIEAVEPEAPVLVVWHPENVKQANATMSKPQMWLLCIFHAQGLFDFGLEYNSHGSYNESH